MLGRLQKRVFWQLGLILLVTISVGGGATLFLLSKKFTHFEQLSIRGKLDTATLLINDQITIINKFAHDYGFWDDSYHFMVTKSQAFIDANFTYESINSLDIDALLFIDLQKTVALSATLVAPTRNKSGFIDFDHLNPVYATLLRELPALEPLRTTHTGIYFVDNQILVVGVSPIVKSDASGVPHGWILMIRKLNTDRLHYLQVIGNADFNIRPANALETSSVDFDLNQFHAKKIIPGDNPFAITLSGIRPLQQESSTTYQLVTLNLLVVWIASLFFVMLGLGRIIINRLENYGRNLNDIREHKNSDQRLLITGNDEIDQVAQSVNEILDEIERQQFRLIHQASHDPLTGLGNRYKLIEQLHISISLLRRKVQEAFCFMLFDLDGFKRINDVYGHPAGDFLLTSISKRLITTIRDTDCAVRLGGDEFAILMPGIYTTHAANEVAERLRRLIALPVPFAENIELQVSASIGLLIVDQTLAETVTPDTLLKQADIAMYQAKNAGRDMVTEFDSTMEKNLLEYVRLEHDLKESISNCTLDVYFQPILTCDAKRIESLEVLGRWFHPELGFISPERFIPIAENAQLIRQYSLGMIYKACVIARNHFAIYPEINLSFNISIQEMLEEEFFDDLHQTLLRAGFPPEHLSLEITETLLAQNEAAFIRPMQLCRNLGITFHVDDFGTGYSSLSRLHSLPISVLKIDKSFVWRINKGGDEIVSAIIRIAHSLKLKVIAEGVENEEQLNCIKKYGCEYVQGYLFAKPMSAKDTLEWLKYFTLGVLASEQ